MSRTHAHVPFHHAYPDYAAYYSRDRVRAVAGISPEARRMYYAAGPDFPREGDKHWSKAERSDHKWSWGDVNRGRDFTRAMSKQRMRAEIADQMAEAHPDDEDRLSCVRDCES